MSKDDFFSKVIFGWIKSDLERMLEIKPIPEGDGNINFPLALCSLADMEYLGSFFTGKEENFKKNVGAYISKCFDNPGDYQINILADIFRNGLAHEFFARGGICRTETAKPLFVDDKFGVVLNADFLAKDFLKSLSKFKENLSEEKYNARRERALRIGSKKLEKNKEFINKLPKNGSPSYNTSSTDVSSTTTGPMG